MSISKAVVEKTTHINVFNTLWLMAQVAVVMMFLMVYIYVIQKKQGIGHS